LPERSKRQYRSRSCLIAANSTQSASSAMSFSTSFVAITPVGGRPTSSPASLPTFSGLVTYTPTSSITGFSMKCLSATLPTVPVAH
jgi:hypothetical protein